MTPHILGIVTEVRGAFLCSKCHHPIEMVAVIDRRSPRARIWREVTPHECEASPFKDVEVYAHPPEKR